VAQGATVKVALVTGGTRGLGAAIALALGRRGTPSVLTHRWASADEAQLKRMFLDAGAPEPTVVEADAADRTDTDRLIAGLARGGRRVDVFVSNVAVVSRGGSLSSLKLRDLSTGLRYSAWPLMHYVDSMERHFGGLPRWILATSSDGPDHYYPGYDYVAASKAALEALAVSLAERTRGTEARVAVLRTRQVDTAGYREVFAETTRALVGQSFSQFAVSLDEVGRAVVALTSGLLDGLHGQVLTVDKGAEYVDNMVAAGPVVLGARA
jgi:NAD(P)-dependent dehydrogenase (short-subunit alcohol dehydrogenase family)